MTEDYKKTAWTSEDWLHFNEENMNQNAATMHFQLLSLMAILKKESSAKNFSNSEN